jgi:hypothetical protein
MVWVFTWKNSSSDRACLPAIIPLRGVGMGWIILAISILGPMFLVMHLTYKFRHLPPKKKRGPKLEWGSEHPPPGESHLPY